MAQLSAHGISVETPPGWEGRIFRRRQHGEVASASAVGAAAPAGELTFPVVHVATIPLPSDDADYASDAVTELGPSDSIVVVKEFAPANAQQALFAAGGIPRVLDADAFAPGALQRLVAGRTALRSPPAASSAAAMAKGPAAGVMSQGADRSASCRARR